ncbi:MAG TPA: MFS transporter [Gemmatimonadales bacterium]|nr:MFS transporter [Gemmatimonadales bacterium]
MNGEEERFGVPVTRGFRVRRVLLALIVGFAFTGYVQRTGVAVAVQRMMPELGLTQVQVGWLFTAFLLTYSVCQLPGALVGQWLGGRRMLSVIGLATVVASVVTAIAPALATGGALFLGLLAARSLLGLAQAALFPVGAGMIRSWFPVGGWASAQALVVTGLWSGAAATPPLVAWLMEAHGWRWALVVTSVPSLVLVVLWHVYARDRPVDHPGVRPDEQRELVGNPPPTPGPAVSVHRLRRLLADRPIQLLTVSYFIMNYVFYLVTFWSFLYLVQERRMGVLESGALAALPAAAAGAAAGAGGWLADRLRARFGDRRGMRVVPLVALPTSAVFLYLTVRAASPYWAVAALCFGFACVEVTEGSYWGATMRRAPDDTMAATGLLNTGGNLGGVVATPIIAALSSTYSWTVVFATGAVLALVAAGLWFWIDTGRPVPVAAADAGVR